jgi:regulation of enolase protein 1 (concanavalin A-like superfamily)
MLKDGVLKIQTEPGTDFWQQLNYGFSKTKAPASLTKIERDFTFSLKPKMGKKMVQADASFSLSEEISRTEFSRCALIFSIIFFAFRFKMA